MRFPTSARARGGHGCSLLLLWVVVLVCCISTSAFNRPCNDTLWCNIPMPSVSYFRFDPPTNITKWNQARYYAMRGRQVILQHLIKHFPTSDDFLDGHVFFPTYHKFADFFVDHVRDLTPLTKDYVHGTHEKHYSRYKWEKELPHNVIPPMKDFRAEGRAPIVKVGYMAFRRDTDKSPYFQGHLMGDATIERPDFLRYWEQVKDRIDTPFIALHSQNENWGILSTYYPNRTTAWGVCCDEPHDKTLREFLDHNKTLLFLVGQHTNITHPKVVVIPRGTPVFSGDKKQLMFDTMRNVLAKRLPKRKLVFASTSSWGPRPQIMSCISKRFEKHDFDGKSKSDIGGDVSPGSYYRRLATSRFGLALPGLGYDTFRLWETLTMGTVVILEKGVGFDKSLWRLPALLVEDFSEVTPELLRVAYVEALYRADEFEYERLTQSFWLEFIKKVSITKSLQTVLEKFPPEAEDPHFTRPKVPFDCAKTNSCGSGTKRIPKTYC